MLTSTRCRFFEVSLMAAAAVSLPAPLFSADSKTVSANEKNTAAIIGCGIRGKVYDDVQETPERTRHYLTDAGVDPDKAKLTLGQHLRVDCGHESFLDNASANALLGHEYRAPYLLPKEWEI